MQQVDIVVGLQWGDEGKGKETDILTPKYDIIARFQGGPNAGHTLEFDDIKFSDDGVSIRLDFLNSFETRIDKSSLKKFDPQSHRPIL